MTLSWLQASWPKLRLPTCRHHPATLCGLCDRHSYMKPDVSSQQNLNAQSKGPEKLARIQNEQLTNRKYQKMENISKHIKTYQNSITTNWETEKTSRLFEHVITMNPQNLLHRFGQCRTTQTRLLPAVPRCRIWFFFGDIRQKTFLWQPSVRIFISHWMFQYVSIYQLAVFRTDTNNGQSFLDFSGANCSNTAGPSCIFSKRSCALAWCAQVWQVKHPPPTCQILMVRILNIWYVLMFLINSRGTELHFIR